jgi:hypothetical protein
MPCINPAIVTPSGFQLRLSALIFNAHLQNFLACVPEQTDECPDHGSYREKRSNTHDDVYD